MENPTQKQHMGYNINNSTEEEDEEEKSRLDQLMDYILNLNQERINCEQQNDFISAGRIKEQLEEIGEEYKQTALISIRDRQQQEKESLEKQYEKEIEDKTRNWDYKLQDNENKIQEMMENILQNQEEERNKYENDLRQHINSVGKATPKILNIEYQIQKCVKKQRYNEAAIMQKKLEKLYMAFHSKNNAKYNEKIRNLMDNLLKKQEKERINIEQKLNSQRNELFAIRESEFEKIHSKFNVFRDKLEANHNNEFLQQQKALKNFNPCSNYLLAEYRED